MTVTWSRRAAAVAWFVERGHDRMLRCQRRYVHTQHMDLWAGCCLLPAHAGRCRYIGWNGYTYPIGDGWVLL